MLSWQRKLGRMNFRLLTPRVLAVVDLVGVLEVINCLVQLTEVAERHAEVEIHPNIVGLNL